VQPPWQSWRQPLWYLAVAAVLAGIYWRFKGLGTAPFAVDEYYLARSIENVLRAGIPAFSCGGLYMRGIALQYTAAALQQGGFTAELAPRLISSICSLLAIPAVFILAHRVHGRVVALLAVTIIALSVWEIEMARFGRMYAPFQAVFLWYLVFFLRYTVDRDIRALWPMIALSILGPLVWEGGVFLSLTNILSMFLQRWPDRLRRDDWLFLLSCTALLALAVWFVTADFRGYNADSWPPGYRRSMSTPAADPLTILRLSMTTLRQNTWWVAAAIAPLIAALLALRWIWNLRARGFLAAGLLLMLIAAFAHQFLVVIAIGLLLLLTRVGSWKELFARSTLPFHLTLILCAMFWIAYTIANVDWQDAVAVGLGRRAAILAYQFFRFPDLIAVVVRPWAGSVPHLGFGLMLLIGAEMYRAARSDETSNYERILLVVFLVLLLAASASHPPRQETRYVFFLYPIGVIIALTTIAHVATWLASRPTVAVVLTSGIALGGFALSEDFQPTHLLHIDSSTETFRIGMSAGMQSHLVLREDFRGIAQWLQQHRSAQELVISGVHGLDHYYPAINYFYVDQSSPNFPDWACRHGTVERWGGYSLLYSANALTSRVEADSAAYLVAFVYDRDQLLFSLAALHPQVVMTVGDTIVLKLQG
jgi:hypothetical protein